MKIYIRGMACESCKRVLKDALIKLNVHPIKIELGVAEIKGNLTEAKKDELEALINEVGLQIVENKSEILVENIKHYCHEYVISEPYIKVNISEFLSQKLEKDYNYLSNVFSEIESCTIVHYINLLKVEKAKELILLEDYNLTEIATKLNFSTLSAFSTQFKKFTGFTPSQFKKQKHKKRLTIQELTKKKQ